MKNTNNINAILNRIIKRLSSALSQKAQELTNGSGDLQAFITDAIAHEIERRQMPKTHQDFWDTVSQIQAELKSDGLEIDPVELWGDVRDASPDREIIL